MTIVSYANPISGQLDPALRNILKCTHSAGGMGVRWTENNMDVKKESRAG